eukprot:21545-Heterococcus_DN1.PRE.1
MIRACDCFVHQALKSYEPELSGYGQRLWCGHQHVLSVTAHSEACMAAACAEAGTYAVRASRGGVRHACVVLAIVCKTYQYHSTPVRRYRPGALVTDPTIQDDISALIKKGKLPARKKATSVNNY